MNLDITSILLALEENLASMDLDLEQTGTLDMSS